MPNIHKSFDQHNELQIKLAIYYKITSNFTWLVCSKIGGYFKILEWTLYRKEHQHSGVIWIWLYFDLPSEQFLHSYIGKDPLAFFS